MKSGSAALKALLENRIDYSGVFPPSRLPLEQALTKAGSFPTALARPYLIGSELVIPYEQLNQIDNSKLKELSIIKQFRIAIINNVACSRDNSSELEERIETCSRFNIERKSSELPQKIISFETKISGELAASSAALDLLCEIAERTNTRNIIFFVEPELSVGNQQNFLQELIVLLLKLNQNAEHYSYGFKARTGGATALSPENLAEVIKSVCSGDLPFKVTGGLHYPFPNITRMHGFLTLSSAVLFTRKYDLPVSSILAILNLKEGQELIFNDALCWDQYSLAEPEIIELLQAAHFSIGCCDPFIQDIELCRIFD